MTLKMFVFFFLCRQRSFSPGKAPNTLGWERALRKSLPAARTIFHQADQALGFSLSALCFEGPAETLQLTENMQPALLTVSVAAWQVLEEQNVRPDFVAGHSLGNTALW